MDRIDTVLRRHFEQSGAEIVAAWLFGSRARGTARAGSDVDVAVLLSKDPPRTLMGVPVLLSDDVSRALGPGAPKVDLVVVNRASADLVHRILREGVLLVDRDPAARIAFEVRKRNEYFDLKPLLDRYRRRENA